jgi:hypothetical protein
MAAQAWKVPTKTKRLLGEGSIDLQGGVFRLVLLKSHAGEMPSQAMSAETMASLITDGVSDHPSVTGYSLSGITLAGVSWVVSGSGVRFDCTDVSISPTGAALSDVKVAVIRVSAGDRIACYATLSTAGFDVADGNKLTITMNSAGILTLT